ncbi:putative glutamate receptor [Halictus rubicundus]|uniref:putative glutamate receptor n=1 Tax=Halictus rubicundus TaxID=77578 RepID=UPI004036FCB3
MKIFVLCIIEVVLQALASRSDIREPEGKSWISDQNFEIMVRLSFPYSTCCNVLFNAPIGDTEILFSQFRSVYPYEYLLRRSTYECNGYFLLGSSDEEILRLIEKIPSLTWKTEILVVVANNQTSDNSGILDDSLYETANVNVVSRSGIWKLDENYLKPRLFTKVSRYEGMLHNYDHINFRGRKLHIASIHRPPMTFYRLPVKKTIDGQEMDVYPTDHGFDGIEVQLFLVIAKKLNFTWTVRKPEGDLMWGEVINGTWEGGIIGMICNNKADIAIGSILVTQKQNHYVQLSEPWYKMYVHLLVPRPRRVTSFWAILKPFPDKVWYMLLLAIMLFSAYTYARAWIDPKFPKRFRNYLITVTDLIGCLLSSSVPKTVANNKLEILLWQTAGWLIITAYCSSLASRLATSEYESRIDTIEQFLATNLSWGNMGQKPPFEDYIDSSDPHSAQLPSRFRHVDSVAEWNELTARTNFVVPGKMIGSCFFPEEYVPNDALKNYRVMKTPIGSFYTAFGLQQWLLTPVNRIMLSLKEAGIVDWHLNDVTRRHNSYNLREVLVEHDGYDGGVQVLGLMPLAAGFSLLLLGSSIAVFVFYMELKRAAKSSSIRHILRAIDGKRKRAEENDGELPRVSERNGSEVFLPRFQSFPN